MSDPTLGKLKAVCRSKPVRRELVCPDCGSGVELVHGLLVCLSEARCGGVFGLLAELAVKGAR